MHLLRYLLIRPKFGFTEKGKPRSRLSLTSVRSEAVASLMLPKSEAASTSFLCKAVVVLPLDSSSPLLEKGHRNVGKIGWAVQTQPPFRLPQITGWLAPNPVTLIPQERFKPRDTLCSTQ